MTKRPKHVALKLREFEQLEAYLAEYIPILNMYTPTADEGYENIMVGPVVFYVDYEETA